MLYNKGFLLSNVSKCFKFYYDAYFYFYYLNKEPTPKCYFSLCNSGKKHNLHWFTYTKLEPPTILRLMFLKLWIFKGCFWPLILSKSRELFNYKNQVIWKKISKIPSFVSIMALLMVLVVSFVEIDHYFPLSHCIQTEKHRLWSYIVNIVRKTTGRHFVKYTFWAQGTPKQIF